MNQIELETLRDSGVVPKIAGFFFETHMGYTAVNEKVPIRIHTLDSSLPDASDLDIFNDNFDLIGVLCFCRRLGDVDLANLTDWQFAAYLTEINVGEYGLPFQFGFDYAVIDVPQLNDYVTAFRGTSVIWGGFSHSPPLPTLKRTIKEVVAQRGIRYPTAHHSSQSLRAAIAAHPFDRFLKLYHQLELLFDWVIVRRVQLMGNDLTGIARVMSRYSGGDLPSLKELLRDYCNQPSELWDKMCRITAYLPTATTVFQDHGKDGNPLKETWSKFIAMLGRGAYDPNHAKAEKLADNGKKDALDKLLVDVGAYWLFRIRCCVAHNRIGEYILSDPDQQFVLEFGEPLLKEVLRQVLANPALP